jgi:glycosyltransferase involved in cell wall biosynthesis
MIDKLNSINIAVVIPSYKVKNFLKDVVLGLPDYINDIIVVDDKCPEESYKVAEGLDKVHVVRHEVNQGVGGALVSGYKKALELEADIVVKVDGDGQMDPKYLIPLLEPLMGNIADYTKGNRFRDTEALKAMPSVRLFGNSMLSFLVKSASGYWSIMDPTNGYTAIYRTALEQLPLDSIDKRYFFESDMLINLNIIDAVVKDVSMPAQYGDEESSLSVKKIIIDFPPKIIRGFAKRVKLKYFMHNFNAASLYLTIGLPLFLIGVINSLFHLFSETIAKNNADLTVVLPLILGLQFLLQFLNLDIRAEPHKDLDIKISLLTKLSEKLKDD